MLVRVILSVSVSLVMLCASGEAKDHKDSDRTIRKTKYFSITLPSKWSMNKPINVEHAGLVYKVMDENTNHVFDVEIIVAGGADYGIVPAGGYTEEKIEGGTKGSFISSKPPFIGHAVRISADSNYQLNAIAQYKDGNNEIIDEILKSIKLVIEQQDPNP